MENEDWNIGEVQRSVEHEEMTEKGICPRCGDICDRDEVDVGVGIMYGPFGCHCGWSEWVRYDSLFKAIDNLDSKGGYWPKGNTEL